MPKTLGTYLPACIRHALAYALTSSVLRSLPPFFSPCRALTRIQVDKADMVGAAVRKGTSGKEVM